MRGLGAHGGGLRFVGEKRLCAHLTREVFDFLLACEHAGLFRIGRVQSDADARNHVSCLHDERAAFRQLRTRREGLCEVVGDESSAEPVVEYRADARIVDAHERQQRPQALRRFQRPASRRRRVKRELGGRRVGGERLHPVEIRDFERRHPLAQRGFERRLPARFDMQLLPEARQAAQFVLVEPRLDLALGLHVLLKLLQRGKPRFELMDLRAFGLHALLRRATLAIEARQCRLRVRETRLRFGENFLVFGKLHAQFFELRFVGRVEPARFGLQPLVTLLQLLELLVSVALMRRFELQRLLGLRDAATLLVQLRLCVAPARFERRQFVVLRGRRLLRDGGLLLANCQRFLCVLDFAARALGLHLPLLALRAQRGDLRLHAIARLDDEADLRLEPAHFGIRFVERALRALHRVARAVVRDAQRFQLRFHFTQTRGLRFKFDLCVADRALLALRFVARLVLAQEPQQALLLFAFGLQLLVPGRDDRLPFELLEIRAQFANDVFDARQIFTRVMQTVLGFATPFLVLRHPRRFFEEHAQFFRLRLDDPRDHALPDDRVGARAEARAEEDVLDVAAARREIVDVVAGSAVAREHALHGDFAVSTPLAGGAAVGVIEDQFDAGPAAGLARRRAIEDHVLHRFAAQLGGARFAEHPAHGIDDVGLATAIGAHDADQLAGYLEMRGIDE
ncbi:hypothetical protein AWB81_05698 [Caballeronia arationis]|nr:hypothetical protein AWB81_05698 [Caballeronia arationis]